MYLTKYKSEAFQKFKEFINEVEKQLGRSIKTLRSYQDGEYLSQDFLDYIGDNGILSPWTQPYTPQHDGVAERRIYYFAFFSKKSQIFSSFTFSPLKRISSPKFTHTTHTITCICYNHLISNDKKTYLHPQIRKDNWYVWCLHVPLLPS